MSEATWSHKDRWTRGGKGFLVEVSRHSVSPSLYGTYEGLNRWCVYAYIYPSHPHFAAFNGPDMWQEAASIMPLHCGPSYLEYPMYEGKVSAVKVGCDYNHLHDDHYTHFASADQARGIFSDADRLFDWLSARAAAEAGSQA